jgi:hypothetical protein
MRPGLNAKREEGDQQDQPELVSEQQAAPTWRPGLVAGRLVGGLTDCGIGHHDGLARNGGAPHEGAPTGSGRAVEVGGLEVGHEIGRHGLHRGDVVVHLGRIDEGGARSR